MYKSFMQLPLLTCRFICKDNIHNLLCCDGVSRFCCGKTFIVITSPLAPLNSKGSLRIHRIWYVPSHLLSHPLFPTPVPSSIHLPVQLESFSLIAQIECSKKVNVYLSLFAKC